MPAKVLRQSKPKNTGLAIEHVTLATLNPAPYNPRTMDDEARKRLERSVREFGMVDPIVARRADKMVIGGHQRLAAAKAVGLKTVPVVFLDDLSDDRAAALNVALNNPAAQGAWDFAKLSELLSELDANGFDATLTGFDTDEIAKLLTWTPEPKGGLLPGVDPDEIPETPEKAVTKPGDVVTLGRHRLICGDCRDFATIERLTDGRKANVVVTSPPYASQRKYDEASGFKPIPPDAYVEWYRDVAANMMAVLADDGSYFCNIKEHCDDGQRHLYVTDLLIAHVREWGWRWVDTFCWRDTRNGVPGGWSNRFKDAWEPVYHFSNSERIKFDALANASDSDDVFTYSRANAKSPSGSGLLGAEKANGYKSGKARPSNVIELPATGDGTHSAQFPVALPAFFARAFSDEKDAILDPFMGSGTTLIAAEQENRTAFGCEISPLYCDVIVSRWEHATGQTAERP